MRSIPGLAALALLGVGLAACATASTGAGDDAGDDEPAPDANPSDPDAPTTPPDAAPPDGPPQPQARTLTQSTSMNITDEHTLTCNQFGSGTTATAENRFYRVFDLTALGITTTYTATRVDFAIESAAATAGSMTLQVKLHTLPSAPTGNSFLLSSLTQLYGQNVTVSPTTLSMQQVNLTTPVVVPAGSILVVELFAPDLTALGNGNYFFPGSNAAGESGPTWIAATECGINDATRMSTVVSPDPQVHWVMAVQGTVP